MNGSFIDDPFKNKFLFSIAMFIELGWFWRSKCGHTQRLRSAFCLALFSVGHDLKGGNPQSQWQRKEGLKRSWRWQYTNYGYLWVRSQKTHKNPWLWLSRICLHFPKHHLPSSTNGPLGPWLFFQSCGPTLEMQQPTKPQKTWWILEDHLDSGDMNLSTLNSFWCCSI